MPKFHSTNVNKSNEQTKTSTDGDNVDDLTLPANTSTQV